MTPDITDDAIMTALRSFLIGVLPDGTEVVAGQANRVPEPASSDFVVMTPTGRMQLSTTRHNYNPLAQTNVVGRSNSITVQLDVYGPNSTDNAQVIATLFRDQYGCDALGPNVQPLYCDDGRQMPLVNGEFQYQDRWTLNATLQANPAITIPQDSALSVIAIPYLTDKTVHLLLYANDDTRYANDALVRANGRY